MKGEASMDDQFLYDFREDPSPEFAENLRRKLREQPASSAQMNRVPIWRKPTAVAVGVAAVFFISLSFPAVRAVAQQFLDLFRVQRFVAVSTDPERLKQIQRIANEGFDLKSLLSRNVKVVKEPGQLQLVESVAAAEQLTGLTVQLPATLPSEVVQEQMLVGGEGALEFTADTALLQEVLDALDLRDVLVPQQLNGAVVKVRMPSRVITNYRRAGMARATLLQAASPEISLPQGVNLPEIVEIALRILGMTLDEARQYAYSIDWHGTLLVPVPADVASFREVEVGTSRGLLIEPNGQRSPGASSTPRSEQGSMVLWSDGGKVFSLSGTINKRDLLQMASAIQ
jgi:hypothetical protein